MIVSKVLSPLLVGPTLTISMHAWWSWLCCFCCLLAPLFHLLSTETQIASTSEMILWQALTRPQKGNKTFSSPYIQHLLLHTWYTFSHMLPECCPPTATTLSVHQVLPAMAPAVVRLTKITTLAWGLWSQCQLFHLLRDQTLLPSPWPTSGCFAALNWCHGCWSDTLTISMLIRYPPSQSWCLIRNPPSQSW